MPETLEVVIPRHCVPSGPDGLSPLQVRLLDESLPVRIFAAPTGAGKSYAFVRAASLGKRVLFVVPTRRLAQNLARSLIESLVAGGTLPEEAAERLAVWTSDETARLAGAMPGLRVGPLRIAQARDARGGPNMVIATPESIAFQLLRASSAGHGSTPFNVADFTCFDHVVFDEFHAIDARGFGLCVAVATLCAGLPNGPKLTFLSATPVDLTPVLVDAGIDPILIAQGREAVVTGETHATVGMRALHGDVTLRFVEAENVASLLEAHEAEVRACLESGRQVVAILDSVETLLRSKDRVAAFLDRIGVPPKRRLAINSVDDSTRGAEDGLFVRDRNADPLAFDVLLATSSVELGVTFRAGLLVMDPGHDALAFVQRLGRVARGDEPGLVIVRRSPADLARRPWLREVLLALAARDGKRIEIDAFLDDVLRAARARFAAKEALGSDEIPLTFRSLPMRALWASMLFWHALERAQRYRGQRETLRDFRPRKAALIAGKLAAIERASHSGKRWGQAFLDEAATLRDFSRTVVVVEPDGTLVCKLPLRIAERYPALAAAHAVPDEEGGWRLYPDRPLREVFHGTPGRFVEEERDALFPDGRTRRLSARDAARDWVARAEQELLSNGLHPQLRPAFEAARDLVRLSGIAPAPPREGEPPPLQASVIL